VLGALVELRVLGDLEIRAAGQRVDAGHARQRSVLAVLLLDLGRVVPPDQLIDRVWGEDPPVSVRNVLYGYVARLRAAFAGAGDPDVMLTRRPGGYLLEADPEQVDLYRFQRLGAEAAAADDDQRAAELLRSALGLWHGRALAGLESPWLDGMRDTLELQRVTAVLDLGDIALRQGEHSALISELAGEAVAYPTDERLIGQLMLALYRSGRQAEALQLFEQTRHRLAEELGADPAPELRALHQRILRGDPSLAAPRPSSYAAASASRTAAPASQVGEPVPHELPADATAFTGRVTELTELDQLLPAPGTEAMGAGKAVRADAGAGPTAVISAVSGTAGVGKTALAVHWAHRVADRFPDGQLYVNLRGYGPGQPVTASDALAGFLRALGVAGQDIPAEEDERAARYRSLLAGRRILVLADNASEVAQVRPLLPGSPGCVAVVTSRDSLAGLVARDGARRLDLDLLPREDAVSLLLALIGARAGVGPDAFATLAEHCARLPLALRVAAELAVARPDVSLADLAGELADQQSRLDLLGAGGDPRTAVRAVFSWSYQYLDAAAARAFRLLGLHPGPGFEAYALAALTGTGVGQARRLLDLLARAHMIQPAGPGRYGMHDLLRAYAAEQATAQDSQEERRAALTRLFDHYLHTAATAMDTLYPAERRSRPQITPPDGPSPPVGGAAAARNWLDAQRGALAAAAAHAADQGWPGHATRLGATLWRYLDTGVYPEAADIHGHALRAAQQTGDLTAQGVALTNLGVAYWRHGRGHQAADHYQQALGLFRQAGDRNGQARALGNLGNLNLELGHLQQATDYLEQGLALHCETGDQAGQAVVMNSLSVIYDMQGRFQQVSELLQRVLALCREIGDLEGVAWGLNGLGSLAVREGRDSQAAGYLHQALALFREVGEPVGEADTLAQLGTLATRQGRHSQAIGYLDEAVALLRRAGEKNVEAKALNWLGEALLSAGQPGDARAQHVSALRVATQVGYRYEQARAHNGLAHSYRVVRDRDRACRHWQEALALFTDLGVPEADEVRAQLVTYGNEEDGQP
jgi:DNA-binding SARP family transcriptional activator/Tfp pilus assembly protein PilF